MRADQSKAGSHSHPSALRPQTPSVYNTDQGKQRDLRGWTHQTRTGWTALGSFQTSTGSIHAYIYQAARANIRLWDGWRAWTASRTVKTGSSPQKKEQTKNCVTEHYLVIKTDKILGFKILQHWQFVVSKPKSPTPPTPIVCPHVHIIPLLCISESENKYLNCSAEFTYWILEVISDKMSILLVINAIYSTETKEILGQTANIQSEYTHT